MEFKFTPENLQKIELETKKYPVRRPAIMFALYLAQEQNGYISHEVINEIAGILELHPHDVLGVVTFYTMYHQKPIGKYHIQVCTNVSCMLRGGYEIWNQVKEKLGIDHMGVTADQKFSLEEVECMGSCGTAPMLAVNEDYFENLTKEKVEELINSLK
ncbi:MAG: NAD(P)H-dependent oxidoreductase subunit E [Ignavibacteriales bacterium UTCHB2]|jgi:NADH-quinone oxidoreductase E subunit|nr:MAG: NADH-quinone oxidoreductase subunit 2 [Ignavibacteria bacterium ADurb.Bin266]OQY72208.1 MAG: NAD(P)H-dependent oxidoreductase subunit E [Ignavibacteriales bacterium UTCHB2]HQI40876.1 NAD(P)H-dependent oxidoreductase subunit E [Ignavibacteriaceae bacterium]HQJ47467.1 NAD(P)H-dependent oxidoreductase subunit E [Ignavibacteriaceae bacterium]